MKLKVEEAPEKVQARLFLFLAARGDGHIEELKSLPDLLLLDLVVYKLSGHRVGVAPHDADGVEAEGVLVLRKSQGGLAEVLACHQVLLGVHLEDSPTEPLVVDCRLVDAARTYLFGLPQVLKGMLVLLDGDIPIRPVHVDVEHEVVVHFLCEFTRGHLIGSAVDGALVFIHTLTVSGRMW
jgi:hypothetical protein